MLFFMTEIVRNAKEALHRELGSFLSRRNPALLSGSLACALIVLAALFWYHRGQVDEARAAQAALTQVADLTREINNLTLVALQKGTLSPQADSAMLEARHALPAAVLGAHLHVYHKAVPQQVWPAIDSYIASADRQWLLMQAGEYDEAKHADFQEVGLQYDIMRTQVRLAIEAEDKWAQGVALKARNELLAAAVLAMAAVLVLFLRLKKQEHLVQLQAAERKVLRESEEHFRDLTEQSTDIILITDLSGRIKYASPSVHSVLGLHASGLSGMNLADLLHPDDVAKSANNETEAANSGQNRTVELRLRHEDGRWVYFECVVRNLIEHSSIGGIVYNARDITERIQAQKELLFNATHDGLTGLPNRALFLGRLQSVVDRLKRYPRQTAAVLFIDIDDFKLVNDCYGHATGDALIQEVSRRLRECMRSEGALARMGGDEFTLLVDDIVDPRDAIRVAERIHASFKHPFLLGGIEIFKSASIGIALTSKQTAAEAVLQNADIAMYRAKGLGKARSELFDRTMHEQVMHRLLLEAKLRHALDNEELELHYQPIVATDTSTLQGFEALLRWQPAESDGIPPSTFIPIAEQCGLIVPISIWVLRKACSEAAGWSRRYAFDPPLCVSINISAKHFSHAGFVGHVKDALVESVVDPQCVTIELTESLAMNDVAATLQTMSQLRDLGVKLSIDDFGTGYSSLSYLRRFPVHTLKIDQSFVKIMDTENYAIVKTIIGLARSLDLKTVAEGVETPKQRQLLAQAGCESGQGFLFAQPMPAQSIDAFIESNQPNSAKRTRLAHSAGKR